MCWSWPVDRGLGAWPAYCPKTNFVFATSSKHAARPVPPNECNAMHWSRRHLVFIYATSVCVPGYVCVCIVGVCLCVCAVVSCCSSLALTQQVGSEKCFCARNLQQLDEPRGEPTLVWRLSRAAVGRVEWWRGGKVAWSRVMNCKLQQVQTVSSSSVQHVPH